MVTELIGARTRAFEAGKRHRARGFVMPRLVDILDEVWEGEVPYLPDTLVQKEWARGYFHVESVSEQDLMKKLRDTVSAYRDKEPNDD